MRVCWCCDQYTDTYMLYNREPFCLMCMHDENRLFYSQTCYPDEHPEVHYAVLYSYFSSWKPKGTNHAIFDFRK